MLRDPRIQVSSTLAKGARGPSRRELQRLARRLRRAGTLLGIDPERWSSLSIRIVDDVEMGELHEQFMGEAGTTDVLSFPGDEFGHVLGDIALGWEVVIRRCGGLPRLGQRTGPDARLDEATMLCVHGLAHLLGHDHRDRREGLCMHKLEAKVLRRLGVPDLPRPYAPRVRGVLGTRPFVAVAQGVA